MGRAYRRWTAADKCVIKNQVTFQGLMSSKGFTRQSLADYCGIHYSSMAYYITGERNPSFPVASKIVKALDVPFDDIFTFVPRKRKGEQ